jgi:tRNA (guanine37-N1)-methyltransferase
MRFDILTIFPEFFRGPFDFGVVPRAFREGIASAHTHDLRAFTHDRHRTVDDRPFGGGEGMVLKPQPICEALASLNLPSKSERAANPQTKEAVILLSAQGKPFTQATARRLATLNRVVLLCGRYEGVDERVSQLLCDEEISVGDYILSGGELAAAIIVDAVVRLLPGVLGHADSSRYESFGEGDRTQDPGAPNLDSRTRGTTEPKTPPRSTNSAGGLLDYPHYTRPAEFLGAAIPEPLGNGDHFAIRRWRREAALTKTLANRPDLLPAASLSDDDREFLASLGYPPTPA